ncbi:cytochrome C biogenesis protein [Halorubrum sp. JWXQ-INN 858]|uniref:cytochrome c biogenesis protein CcdA n=1 Tax=Halorubrum sp. JWXQ-INN 858 TaxID=2690782 RepID=UPI0013FB3B50|nr:cytochrome c biogenesis protein CcdA [Halorubrum sp. JWXQ-INN 858]MWV65427.1 cytochrome C biogenesis protein [Halorubrum sp. JWXQ-INN 858]
MIDGGSFVAFAAGLGVATFFSPCAYALLPGYVGYYVAATGSDRPPLSGVLVRAAAATAGVFVAFGLVIGVVIAAGRSLEPVVPVLEAVVGVALVAVGAFVVARGSVALHVPLPRRRAGILGFAVFGGAYAAAATACVFPVFFALVVRSLSMPPTQTAVVLGAYAASFGALMLGVTTAAAVGHRLTAGALAGGVDRFVKLSGVVIAAAGVGQLYVAFW